MKVYIGWSGKRSKMIGEIFKDMLPLIIQDCKPFFSPEIRKGEKWVLELTKELRDSPVGIICLTKENLNKPWILFEAGALSNGIPENHVCTFLFNLKSSDLDEPLSIFQDTKNTKEDLFKLINTINSYAQKPYSSDLLTKTFEKWWPDFEDILKTIPQYEEITGEELPPPKNSEVILEEILETVRDMNREEKSTPSSILYPSGGRMKKRGNVAIIKVEPGMVDEMSERLLHDKSFGVASLLKSNDANELIVKFYEPLSLKKIAHLLEVEGVKDVDSKSDYDLLWMI